MLIKMMLEELKEEEDVYLYGGDTLTYTITFPLDATPELKLTIINAVMLMDMIYR